MDKNQFKFLETALGKDEERKSLMFLEFNVTDCNCVIRAANAFLIKQIKTTVNIPNGKYYLASNQVAKLLKISTAYDIIELTVDGVLCDDVLLKWSDEDFSYPNLDSLITGDYGPTDKAMGFNTTYMMTALKNAPSDVFKIEFKRDDSPDYSLTSPTRTTFYEFPYYTVIIMPVRIKW